MADIFIDSAGDQFRCSFKREQLRIGTFFFIRPALCPQRIDSECQWNNASDQENQRNDLKPRQPIAQPFRRVDEDETENRFPCKETIEAMRIRMVKRGP